VILRRQGNFRLILLALRSESLQLPMIEFREAEAARSGDDQVEHGPAEAEAARLAGEAAVRRQRLSDFSALLLMDTLGADSHSGLARL
jgi:hypothetical protein